MKDWKGNGGRWDEREQGLQWMEAGEGLSRAMDAETDVRNK